MPAICDFLFFGVALLSVSGRDEESDNLFGLKDVKKVFDQWLSHLIESIDEDDSSNMGFSKETADFGAHSLRKGSATYRLSFPNAAASVGVLLRGGWTLGGKLPRYVAALLKGDQTCGRYLCGLPANELELSLLLPRFTP